MSKTELWQARNELLRESKSISWGYVLLTGELNEEYFEKLHQRLTLDEREELQGYLNKALKVIRAINNHTLEFKVIDVKDLKDSFEMKFKDNIDGATAEFIPTYLVASRGIGQCKELVITPRGSSLEMDKIVISWEAEKTSSWVGADANGELCPREAYYPARLEFYSPAAYLKGTDVTIISSYIPTPDDPLPKILTNFKQTFINHLAPIGIPIMSKISGILRTCFEVIREEERNKKQNGKEEEKERMIQVQKDRIKQNIGKAF